MDDDLLTLLRSSKIFSSLSNRTIKKLIPQFEKIELLPDEVLYYQGDPSDSIEILQSGKLATILTTANGEHRIIDYVEPGDTVGEIGTISGEPRPITIKAVKNSILFKLPSEFFVELCHAYPSVLFAIINPIVSRSQKIIRTLSGEKFKRHVVFIPANDIVSMDAFIKNLTDLVNSTSGLVLLSDYNDQFTNTTPDKIQAFLDDAKSKNIKKIKQRRLYVLKHGETTLGKYALEKADIIYVIADDKAPKVLDEFVLHNITEFKENSKSKPELIILHDDDTKLPENTASWLKLNDFNLHHHIRLNRTGDYQRLLRFIRNKAIGVVLGGGGTRGWAHVGAIKALIEAGIPIDAIGGASVGSIVAASYAISESHEVALAEFHELIEHSRYTVSWRNITWPAISLYNAKGLTSIVQKLYDDIEIEDLWLPYFCVSTNFAKNIEVIHQTGSLWKSIRCSISMPGVIPPMLMDGELHFDGGLLNNLPVDVMRKLITHRGNVIAVDLNGSTTDSHIYNFPPVLTFRQAFLAKLGIIYDYKFPPFIDTFLRSLLVGSYLKSQQNSLAANILVNVDLSRFPMLHSDKKQENNLVDLGYDTTVQQIKNMQRKK